MKIRFFSRFTLHSLIAMIISWLISSALVVMVDGGGQLDEMMLWAGLLFSFVLIIWVFFIFPFIKYFNVILAHPIMRIYFPVFSTFYALLVFAMMFGFTLGFKPMMSLFHGMNMLAVTAALIGGIWGLLYQLLFVFERRRSLTN